MGIHRYELFNDPISLDINKFESAKEYLSNPTSNGLWFLNLKLGKKDGLTSKVIESILKKVLVVKGKKSQAKYSEYRELNLFDYFYQKDKKYIHRIDVILNLYLNLLEKKKNERPRFNYENLIYTNADKNIINKYPAASDIFKKRIYSKNFSPKIKEFYVNVIDNSLFILLKENHEKNEYKFVSTEKKALDVIKSFFESIDECQKADLFPIYSPQQTIFLPYFYILEAFFRSLGLNENISQLIGESIDQFRKQKYSYTINNIGLIIEDYLHNIYETIFREEYPEGKTLGDIYEKLSAKTGDIYYETPKKNSTSFSELVKRIDVKFKDKKTSVKDLLEIDRTIIDNILNEFKIYDKKLSEVKSKKGVSFLPNNIKSNIKEIIENRNLVSHVNRGSIKIGDFEALRSIFCTMSIITWWTNLIKQMDWSKDKRTIVMELIKLKKVK